MGFYDDVLVILEGVGERREWVITLGDKARLLQQSGETKTALELHKKRLAVAESLGEQGQIAHSLWSIAQFEPDEGKQSENLLRAYQILLQIKDLLGICHCGLPLGELLFRAGHIDQGRPILTRVRDGFLQLGLSDLAKEAQSLLDQFPESQSIEANS